MRGRHTLSCVQPHDRSRTRKGHHHSNSRVTQSVEPQASPPPFDSPLTFRSLLSTDPNSQQNRLQSTLYQLAVAICTIALTSSLTGSTPAPSPQAPMSSLSLPPLSTPLEVRSAAVSNPSVPTIRLAGSINNSTSAIFLADSGATALFMDTAMARRCKLDPRPSTRTVKLADGSIKTATGTVTATIALQIETQGLPLEFEAEFCVTELQGYDVILGMPWLSHFNPAIDWSSGRLVVQRPEGPVTLKRYITSTCEEREPEVAAVQQVECSAISYARMARMIRKGHVDFDSIELMRVRSSTDGVPKGKMEPAAGLATVDTESPQDPQLRALLKRYGHLIPDELPSGLPPKRAIEHKIELTGDAKPHAPPLRRYSPLEDEEIRTQVAKLLERGHARESTSPWGAMVLLAKKKDGGLRFCVDYRVLNNQTLKNRYALPLADDCFDRAQGARFFTKLDLHSGFWQIRLDEASAPLTAFRTRFGHYEFTVLPMGLCNAPATFMHLMNSVLRKQLDQFVLAFLDDIFIYSKTREEHLLHIEEVLKELDKQKLYLKPTKCEWMKPEVEFLGHRIGREGLSVDPQKIDAVKQWPTPTNVSELRSFLGLAGYYRRFINNYSLTALPLTELTKDEVEWKWQDKERSAFETLKLQLGSAPVLLLADPKLPYIIHCDASGYAVGACLMQDQGNGLQPVSYISSKMKPAEANYAPHEKELLALVYACTKWRHYLHNGQPFTVLSDHQSLRYFTTQPDLSSRQARWKDRLAEFNFSIRYIEGPKNVVADALSRRPDHQLKESDAALQGKSRTRDEFLASIRVETDLKLEESWKRNKKDTAERKQQQQLLAVAELSATTLMRGDFELVAEARAAAQKDVKYAALLNKPPEGQEARDGLLWLGKRLCVPNDAALRTKLLAEMHDTPTGGHFGRDKTLAALKKRFHWEGMSATTAAYVAGCDMCQRVKHSQQLTPGLLMPLPVPEEIDSHWTMDFVTGLPKTARGHDTIQGHFSRGGALKRLAATDTTVDAARAADTFIDCVVRHHGVPASIVSDRGPQFVAKFWDALWARIGSKIERSTAHHAQTDGKSEREQKTLETWLRAFCTEFPRDWDRLLPLAELALNSMPQAASGVSPYQLLYGREPALSVDRALDPSAESVVSEEPSAAVDAAKARWAQMAKAWHRVRGKLLVAQDRMKRNADQHRRPAQFKEGDAVLLATEHLKIVDSQFNRKLAHLYCGPFPVQRVINANAYELELPAHMRIHSTVNISHLRPYRDGRAAFPDRPASTGLARPPPEAADPEVWEVDRVLAQRGAGRNAKYLVLWKGYAYTDASWEPLSNLTGSQLALEEFRELQKALRRPERR